MGTTSDLPALADSVTAPRPRRKGNYCPHCGASVHYPRGAPRPAFCSTCGKQLVYKESKKAPAKGGRKTRKYGIADQAMVERILAAADGLSRYHWAVLVILVETGMHSSRLQEIGSANVEGAVFHWTRTKNQKECVAPMTPRLTEALKVFFSERRRTRAWYWTMVKEAGQAAGVEKLAPMSLRHTRCVRLLLEGWHEQVICQLMGCSLRLVQQTYGILTPEQLSLRYRALAERAMPGEAPVLAAPSVVVDAPHG